MNASNGDVLHQTFYFPLDNYFSFWSRLENAKKYNLSIEITVEHGTGEYPLGHDDYIRGLKLQDPYTLAYE